MFSITLGTYLQGTQGQCLPIEKMSVVLPPNRSTYQEIRHQLISKLALDMVYKSLNGLAPTNLSTIFSRNSTRDTVYLRNSETDLQVPLFKTANGQNSFAYRGAHLWNSLESEAPL